ncbi:hypothetical protein [Escherichia coli]|uniref:hypothetical protein n=1 Tax=Escherichia coli TaxID=562 RepID=UPI001AD7F05C
MSGVAGLFPPAAEFAAIGAALPRDLNIASNASPLNALATISPCTFATAARFSASSLFAFAAISSLIAF